MCVFSENGSRYKRSLYLIKWSPTNFPFFNLAAYNGCFFFL